MIIMTVILQDSVWYSNFLLPRREVFII